MRPEGSARDREIVDARVIVTCPGRNFVTLLIATRAGVVGFGDATLNGRELAVASYLQDHVVPNLIGRDAGRIEDTWQFLYRGAYWRRGPVTMTAIAAVDVALWDILAKLAGMPLYQLLGGRSREGALVYGHANGATSKRRARKWAATSSRASSPCARSAESRAEEELRHLRRRQTRTSRPRVRCRWRRSGRRRSICDIVPKLFERLRADHGPDVELLHDVHHRLTPIEAARLARDLEPYRLFWLEDRDAGRQPERVRADPPALGDAARGGRGVQLDLGLQAADRKAADRLHPHHASSTPAASRMCAASPISRRCTGCAPAFTARPICRRCAWARRCTSIPGCRTSASRNTCSTPRRRTRCFRTTTTFLDGRLHCGERPGHGVDFDEKLAASFPVFAEAVAGRASGRRLDVGLVSTSSDAPDMTEYLTDCTLTGFFCLRTQRSGQSRAELYGAGASTCRSSVRMGTRIPRLVRRECVRSAIAAALLLAARPLSLPQCSFSRV